MSRRRGGGEEHGPGMERWLLTYADMITLLLALFVILFAISTINAKKFLAFELGVTSTFSNKPANANSGGSGLLPDENSLLNRQGASVTPVTATQGTPANTANPATAASTTTPTLPQIASQITKALRAAGLSQYASTTLTSQGVVVQMLADKTYFATDSATLGTIGEAVVDTIAGVLRTVPNNVEVQGYTNNLPVTGGAFSSNWELSAVRAVNVVRRLSTTDGITGNRLSATGFGTTHPVVPNTTPANKAENRRVDVVVLTPKLTAPSALGGAK